MLGGVRVNVPQNIDDPDSHAHLSKGWQRLNGEQALGLVRTRHGIGDGSDLGRIELQRTFMKALLTQIRSTDVLTDPVHSYQLLDDVTSAITTDKASPSSWRRRSRPSSRWRWSTSPVRTAPAPTSAATPAPSACCSAPRSRSRLPRRVPGSTAGHPWRAVRALTRQSAGNSRTGDREPGASGANGPGNRPSWRPRAVAAAAGLAVLVAAWGITTARRGNSAADDIAAGERAVHVRPTPYDRPGSPPQYGAAY
ncbi:LCP family protein [Streptomyces sp. TRM68367]|uniref:LCP family protein n=1 Tax=Streptomyces sp. TRM68367 TaxID=2758415 RepID=UPI00165CCA68|nr:LCP family protein [Streptomyces sp. TRM68367]MBC9724792.1 LCP family protein [Streptomyces sp. TRM68367]